MSTSDDPAVLRADIDQTRQELGDSVEALAERADVKARAKDAVADVKDRAKDAVEDAADTVRRRPGRVAGVAAGFAALFGGIAFLHRRRGKRRAKSRWRSR